MKLKPTSNNNVIPFSLHHQESNGEFVASRSKIIMKTSLHQPIPDAYGIYTVDAARITEFHADLQFEVELRRDQMRQSLLCGLISPDYRKGVAVALDPTTGAIVDALNGSGPLGYLTSTPILPGQTISFGIQIQKFGRNFICSISILGERLSYPAFVSTEEEIFNAVVGSDVGSGSAVCHRNATLKVHQSEGAKVA